MNKARSYEGPRITAGNISDIDPDRKLEGLGFAIIYFTPATNDSSNPPRPMTRPKVEIDCEGFNWSGHIEEGGRSTFLGAVNTVFTKTDLYLGHASRLGDSTLQGDLYALSTLREKPISS